MRLPPGSQHRLLQVKTQLRSMAVPVSYENWSRDELIARLRRLERASGVSARQAGKDIDFAAHPRRKIALKFCYSGWEYGGLAFQEGHTVLPAVENVLFDALARTRLVDPAAGFEGCGWERCGRTDRGVSSAGQVVSLWVRTALDHPDGPSYLPPERNVVTPSSSSEALVDAAASDDDSDTLFDRPESSSSTTPQARKRPEFQYVSILNRVLPMTIRILAWSPVSPEFSSRFACKYRHYKYFFTSHGLDIDRMRDGARRLVGEHDFRNLCKLDPAKQITNFKRKILCAEISAVDERPSDQETSGSEGLFVFDLMGTAFLYNQVRHIVAVLFMIGTGLEHPSVITSLVNTDPNNPYPSFQEGEPTPEIVDTKPEYQMADALPLMLWDCAYDDNDVSWRVTNDETGAEEERIPSANGSGNVIQQLHSIYTRSRISTALNGLFLTAGQRYVSPPASYLPIGGPGVEPLPQNGLLDIPLGGGMYRHTSKYIPLLHRNRLEHVDVVNQRWRAGKGMRREARKQVVDQDGDE
ncbi:pseudouridine synthase [Neolentinus lepideus HHB14362 ss-1]|uniref:Pseudouridine synthase n=1 Tax=Neolentinus lepideus HHB14362 ss-1 TaxID=1314782 RepID=A0A165SD26_9AGAM|nr:pseudouridine synthase [Neolentinus lepideus HHB14362 ss-1]